MKHCVIQIETDSDTPGVVDTWGPYPTRAEAEAKRADLRRIFPEVNPDLFQTSMMAPRTETNPLYVINDALTALAAVLNINFGSEEAKDEALQDATLAVAQAFGITR